MAKNYIKQFMEDNGLEVGKHFIVGYSDHTGCYMFNKEYELERNFADDEHEFLHCYSDDAVGIWLLSGQATVVKQEPKAKKIHTLSNFLVASDASVEGLAWEAHIKINELIVKINEIIDAVNGLIEEK